MTKTSRSTSLTRDSLLLASSVFVIFGCISNVQSQPQPAAIQRPVAARQAADLGGSDGAYLGSSFTGHRSLGEFGLHIEQRRDGFAEDAASDTMFRVTTYSFLGGNAEQRRRVRIHDGRSCFFRGDVLATHMLKTAPATHHADGVSSEHFQLGLSLAERVLVHEVFTGGSWVEANCTVTQRDQA